MDRPNPVDVCELCDARIERKGPGQPPRYCKACTEIGRALRLLQQHLPASPGAIVGVLEVLADIDVDRGALTDTQVRRARSAAFVMGSRGRKLEPGSSGRYGGKRKNPPELPAPVAEAAASLGAELARRPQAIPGVLRALGEGGPAR